MFIQYVFFLLTRQQRKKKKNEKVNIVDIFKFNKKTTTIIDQYKSLMKNDNHLS